MRKYTIHTSDMTKVIDEEELAYERYKKTINEFRQKFLDCGFEIKMIECWTNGTGSPPLTVRPSSIHNYTYWICYEVLRNDRPVIYDNEGSMLSRSYVVLSISDQKCTNQHEVHIYDEMDDVTEELEQDFLKLKYLLS